MNVSPERRCACNLAFQRCGGHLTSGHSIDRVVHKEYCNRRSSLCRVDKFKKPDRSRVSVTLNREYRQLRPNMFQSRGHCRRPPMCGHYMVEVEVVVGENAATDRVNHYSFLTQT